MPNQSQWTYTVAQRPGSYLTVLKVQTVPEHVQRRLYPSLRTRQLRYPPTPRIPYLNLPENQSHFFFHIPDANPTAANLFPIDLSHPGPLSRMQKSRLTDHIPKFTPISIRNIRNKVLCQIETGACPMHTVDFVEFLQHLVHAPLETYDSLSQPVRESVRRYFLQRCAGNFGRCPGLNPSGVDLLLGNTVLWTLDTDSQGFWVATVDLPRTSFRGHF
ncbi:hypothetical protein FB45DRAFT_906432 [Roridomyces roridus]|uniref:Uncharacterized protein n=1 Tax=Roridomyces roridus TaxID=1738132 RepID=A0AAD7C2T9_9AGAR|nr:hypothetical protein FB45DRAFT_906432 [Roridomyces roridus]